MEKIREFYAVTLTSIYHVRALGEHRASTVKVVLRGESVVEVGEDISEDGMVAICKKLQGYVPEKYGPISPMTGFERRFEMVNTKWWKGNSSAIVALFKTRNEADVCFECSDLRLCDKRWRDSTRQVLEEIGDDHPSFYVSHYEDLELLPNRRVKKASAL